jgi:glycerol-3-phosphate acyltransferase PlsX
MTSKPNKRPLQSDPNHWVAVDIMGGDQGPVLALEACARALHKHPKLHLILVGDQAVSAPAVSSGALSAYTSRIQVAHASEAVAMDEDPVHALRHKKDSSMRVMAQLVADGHAASCVSAGNTGALVAITKYVLKTLPGVTRPGLMALVPTKQDKNARMIDLGANLALVSDQYVQFALMTGTLAAQVDGIANPRIGLLNVGSEEMKGSPAIKEADVALREASARAQFDYIGFVEGGDVYGGDVDVVLCDGFVGNIALKIAEGTARLVSDYTRKQFTRSFWRKCIGLMAKPIFADVKAYLDPSSRNGANLLGLRGIVIKSHGGCDVAGFVFAIDRAYAQGALGLTAQVQAALAEHYHISSSS